jgi:hypothetical protein
MEQAHPGGAALEQEEVREWEDPAGEEWVAPVRVRVRKENAFALNAGHASPMKWPSPAIIGNAHNAAQRW